MKRGFCAAALAVALFFAATPAQAGWCRSPWGWHWCAPVYHPYSYWGWGWHRPGVFFFHPRVFARPFRRDFDRDDRRFGGHPAHVGHWAHRR